ncbi:hypothetical protein SUGI_1514020 [Cryptomeria japonica]|uniref:Uncharacterized protein n=1 Tax=Cryptomeria japonica TaxID=3369 RepID=A0AAD3NS70_CRYJA|nr:hypothetical protein SUGI_1485410 [Cryptomeria japonica]GLJ59059.1 hypothetical protein SUGI_1490460 [Cryptomeria japonica]GLJ59316.1 hypothetical protein SUGI_1502710 [Cryptomeria japonica]GLJ59419.1 hypothetical protein SUGI_1507800 [Cryptomeria japonica]GLJ59558.1 hypothetical protein SUGI_1514020 [Cryptomeria japonica]
MNCRFSRFNAYCIGMHRMDARALGGKDASKGERPWGDTVRDPWISDRETTCSVAVDGHRIFSSVPNSIQLELEKAYYSHLLQCLLMYQKLQHKVPRWIWPGPFARFFLTLSGRVLSYLFAPRQKGGVMIAPPSSVIPRRLSKSHKTSRRRHHPAPGGVLFNPKHRSGAVLAGLHPTHPGENGLGTIFLLHPSPAPSLRKAARRRRSCRTTICGHAKRTISFPELQFETEAIPKGIANRQWAEDRLAAVQRSLDLDALEKEAVIKNMKLIIKLEKEWLPIRTKRQQELFIEIILDRRRRRGGY